LSYEVEVLDLGPSGQLVIQVREFVFKFELQCLEHLLNLRYLSLAVEDRLDFMATRLRV